MAKGSVFLIPTYLSDTNNGSFIAPMVTEILKNTTYYLVENVRTARRFISSLELGLIIPELKFEVVDKKTPPERVSQLVQPVHDGMDVGVISEAGLPGLADPGSLIVSWAHRNNVRVIPLPGATSIQTAVITSGFSGQQYVFHGYLPIKKDERIKSIRNLEHQLNSTRYTQVFMETPYRNRSLMEDLLNHLDPNTWLHIASDLFGKEELVATQQVKTWKKSIPDLHKIPSIFSIGHLT